MLYVLWSFFLLVTLAQAGRGQDVVSLLRAGNIDSVRAVLNGREPMTLTDGNLLYCAGVLESNAEKSARLFERALNYSPSESCREEMIARMVEYYCLIRNLDRMAEKIAMYFKQYPDGERRLEVERYSVLLAQLRKDNDTAIRQADRFLTENKSGETVQWLTIDKARSLQKMGKHIGAE